MIRRETRLARMAVSTLLAAGVATVGAHAQAQGTAAPTAPGAGLATVSGAFTLDPKGASDAHLGYIPMPLDLSTEKPAGITKEPAYRAKPKYATFHLGNGPKSTYFVALDEPDNADWKIYVDVNRNGDLTDDGDGAWKNKADRNGRTLYGVNEYSLRASWGTVATERSSGLYGVAFYRFSDLGVAQQLLNQVSRLAEGQTGR